MNDTRPDKTLFRLVADGDTEAFRALYDRYRQSLYGAAMKLSKSAHQSEEILQEVFISVWINRSKLPAVEKPDAYLFVILYNALNSYLRKASNRERILRDAQLLHQSTAENNTEQVVDFHEKKHLIEKAVQLLSPQQKLVYTLSRKEGRSLDEIADQLGLSRSTVKTHLSKALDFIRSYLDSVAMVAALVAGIHEHLP